MRVKIRVWDKELKKFINQLALGVFDSDKGYAEFSSNSRYEVEPWRGRVDMKRDDIFVGDVIQYAYEGTPSAITYVRGDDIAYFCAYEGDINEMELFEYAIIGNIHENPELLEVCE